MPPDPVGRRERSRARPPILGARPVLARCAGCAPPMPPDPCRPARALSRSASPRCWGGHPRAGSVRCSPAARAAFLRCPQTPSAGSSALALGLPPLLGRASSRGLRPVLARCAGCAPQASPDPLGSFGRAACLCTRRWLLAQLAALLLVVAAVEDV